MPTRFIRAFAIAALVVLWSSSARAANIDALYARALLAFNPSLGQPTALRLAHDLIAEADACGLDARLLAALVAVESRWHPEARSPVGAQGLGQLMPATAAGLGVDATDAAENLHGAALHLANLLHHYGNHAGAQRYALSLAAYNAGAGAVDRAGGIPPYAETQRYVRVVLALWRRLGGGD